MKLIEIESDIRHKWGNDGKPTNGTYTETKYINPDYIVSVLRKYILPQKNDFVSIPEQICCEVIMSQGNSYVVNVSAEEFAKKLQTN